MSASKEDWTGAFDVRLARICAKALESESFVPYSGDAISGVIAAFTPKMRAEALGGRDGAQYIRFFSREQVAHPIVSAAFVAALDDDGDAIKYVAREQRTPAMCVAAVRSEVYAIDHLDPDERTPEVCAAVLYNLWPEVDLLTEEEQAAARLFHAQNTA